MKYISTNIKPNHNESKLWIDLSENPYGGVVKYYNDDEDAWVYLDEPRFQQSAASKFTQQHLNVLNSVQDLPGYTGSLQEQIVNLDETKANKIDVYSIDEAFVDLTGLDRVLNLTYEEIAQKIKTDIETFVAPKDLMC